MMDTAPEASRSDSSPSGSDTQLDRDGLADKVCSEIVRRHKAIEATFGDESAAGTRSIWYGEIVGLRIALCLLYGWDPRVDADKEGKADELVVQWWEQNDPQYWSGE